jgi:hypothetical protein
MPHVASQTCSNQNNSRQQKDASSWEGCLAKGGCLPNNICQSRAGQVHRLGACGAFKQRNPLASPQAMSATRSTMQHGMRNGTHGKCDWTAVSGCTSAQRLLPGEKWQGRPLIGHRYPGVPTLHRTTKPLHPLGALQCNLLCTMAPPCPS